MQNSQGITRHISVSFTLIILTILITCIGGFSFLAILGWDNHVVQSNISGPYGGLNAALQRGDWIAASKYYGTYIPVAIEAEIKMTVAYRWQGLARREWKEGNLERALALCKQSSEIAGIYQGEGEILDMCREIWLDKDCTPQFCNQSCSMWGRDCTP